MLKTSSKSVIVKEGSKVLEIQCPCIYGRLTKPCHIAISVHPPYITSDNNDILHSFGFFANLLFQTKRSADQKILGRNPAGTLSRIQ